MLTIVAPRDVAIGVDCIDDRVCVGSGGGREDVELSHLRHFVEKLVQVRPFVHLVSIRPLESIVLVLNRYAGVL